MPIVLYGSKGPKYELFTICSCEVDNLIGCLQCVLCQSQYLFTI